MAISPIGNLTYINQNTQASLQNHTNRLDTAPLNLQEHTDRLKEIEEVRTPEDTQKINKDKKEQKNPSQQQAQEQTQNIDSKEDETPSTKQTTQLLDILI